MGFKVIDNTNLSDLWQRSKDMTDNRIKNSDLASDVKEISDISINAIPTIHKVTSIDLYGGGMIEALYNNSAIAISIGDYIYAENDISKTFNFGYEVTKTLKAGYYRVKSVYSNGHAVICVTNSSTVPDSTYGIVNITDLEKTVLLERLDVNNKVNKVTGKGLSTNDYTNEDKAKVDGIPTKTSDLQNDSDFVSDANYVHTDNNYSSAEKNKLSGIESGAQVNFDFNNTTSQMLRGTNSNKTTATGLWTDSAWYTNGNVISVSNAPNPDIKYGYSLARWNNIRQKDIAPSDDNYTDYTVSFYAKGTGILNIELMYEEGTAFNPYYMTFSTPFNIESSKWKRYAFTIKKEDSHVNAYSTHLGLGIVNNSTEEVTLQICGVKMERGDVATPWCLSQYEIDNANVDLSEIESDIDTLETNQTQILSDIEDLERSLSTTSTATGNPISISDSAHVNAEELTVELELIQDLHGYDKPWVGGAGKNKCPAYTSTETQYGVAIAGNSEGEISVNGTLDGTEVYGFILNNSISLGAGTYTLNGANPNGAVLVLYDVNDNVLAYTVDGKQTFTLESTTTTVLRMFVYANVQYDEVVRPMIRLATETDPTFEPYSNICPISGYDETSVVRSGKNMAVGIEQGVIHPDTSKVATDIRCRAKEFVPIKKNSTLTLNVNTNKSKELQICYYLCESNTFGGGNAIIWGGSWMSNPATITIPENCYLIYTIRYGDDSTISSSDLSNIQLELGSTATSYEPYTADTYTLQFGDTVYGAEVDFVSGVATVTKGYIAEYAGETLPSTWISDRDVYASGTTPTTGAEVVYELATPYTIQLTPQQIKMLKGNNVLVADGDIDLTYQVDSVVGDVKEWAEEHFIPYNTYRTPPVYGFHIDGNNSDPSSRVTYIADNANYTPAYMDYTANKFRYNSWQDAWFIKYCKPCILNQDGTVKAYLNPNDYTKDVDGNTVVIDENLTDANVEIEFPEIWYKVVPDAGDTTSASIYFSPVKVDEDYKDYAYIDKDGVHKEHFYMPAYNGSVLSETTVMRSISGQAVSKNLDASTEIAYAKANGNGWFTEDAGEAMLINFLLILMGKSTDTQTVFGRGIDSGSETAFNNYVTGAGNLKGLFYGTNTGTGLVKVFGIENWWGLQWRRYAGDVLDNGVRKVKLCYGNEDGSTTFDFNIDGTGYVDVGVTPSGTNGGYIRTMKFTHDGMYSAISDGSSSTYYCDGQWFNNTYHTIYALRGGSSGDGVHCGAFCVSLSFSRGDGSWSVGAAVSYK